METVNVLFSGVGGQGILLASMILSKAAFQAGYMVKESELHGMAQRGGSVISHVRFGEEVHSPLIPKGRADFLVALEELEGLRNVFYLKPGGRIVLNRKKVVPPSANPDIAPYPEDTESLMKSMGFSVDSVNALGTAQDLGNPKVENIIVMGILSRHLSFPLSTWEKVIRSSVPSKTVEINLSAFWKGRDIADAKAA